MCLKLFGDDNRNTIYFGKTIKCIAFKNQLDISLGGMISREAMKYSADKVPVSLLKAALQPKGRPPTPISVSLVMTQANFAIEHKLAQASNLEDFWRLCSQMIPRMRDLADQLGEDEE